MKVQNLTVAEAFRYLQAAAAKLNSALENGTRKELTQAARDFHETASWVMGAYCHSKNWRDGVPIEHFPVALAREMFKRYQYAAVGKVPFLIQIATGPGQPAPGPDERMAIGTAVAYIKAARKKLISDPFPIRIVADKYGVSLDTVKRWLRKYTTDTADWDAVLKRYADDNMLPTLRPAMEEAGRRQKIAGRGSSAIRARGSKRRGRK